MPFDGMVMAAITRELAGTLTGCRIDRIYQPAREEVHLILSRPGAKYRLLLSADPGTARIHITGAGAENPPSPPVFCMVLRKHLEGGRIYGFSQPGYDRVLTIAVDTRDDLGRPSLKHIICEIMGKHSNIILLDPGAGIILDGIKRYSHTVSRHREVLPGRRYIPPPAGDKINPLSLGDEEFFGIMLENGLNSRVRDIIQKRFDGLSPLLAREIVYRAGLDRDIILDRCGAYDLTSVYTALKNIYESAGNGDFRPTVAFEGRSVRDFGAFDPTCLEGCTRQTGGMNEMTDLFFRHRSLDEKNGRIRQSILSVVRKETSRLEKKLSLQSAEFEAASGAETLRLAGELVTANLYRLKKGDTVVYLENFYKEGCPPEKIDLDPRFTPSENAQNFFKKYARAKKTTEAASHNIQKTKEEIDYLGGVENSAGLSSITEELDQIKEELVEQGYMKAAGRPAVKAVKKEKSAPRPATFTSSQGFTIMAGKNNRQNDYLTMRLALPGDIWLHAREIPGSHVIIKTGGKEAPAATLEEAASLAALFSRAGQSGKVPVDYTLRKHVSKPRGAKPGYVIYTGQKTIMAQPDSLLAEKLSQAD
ncbi:MAG: NFACT family protein [Actinobacteria bacterium]|nr:NFACT family protein [Actinomycetota bacterium]